MLQTSQHDSPHLTSAFDGTAGTWLQHMITQGNSGSEFLMAHQEALYFPFMVFQLAKNELALAVDPDGVRPFGLNDKYLRCFSPRGRSGEIEL